jgi:hypothetical protein
MKKGSIIMTANLNESVEDSSITHRISVYIDGNLGKR